MADSEFVMVNPHEEQNKSPSEAHPRTKKSIEDNEVHALTGKMSAAELAKTAYEANQRNVASTSSGGGQAQPSQTPVTNHHTTSTSARLRHNTANETAHSHTGHITQQSQVSSSLPPSLQALAQVWRHPTPKIAPPDDGESVALGTSTVSYISSSSYISPLTLVDPVRPARVYNASTASSMTAFDSHMPEIAMSVVNVTEVPRMGTVLTTLSDKANELLARGMAAVTESSTLAAYTPRPGLINSVPIRRLLMQCESSYSTVTEDAALMRALALMCLNAPAKLLKQSTHIHSDLQFACGSSQNEKVRWTTPWTKAECAEYATAQKIQLGQVKQIPYDQEIKCRVLTLDEYLSASSADEAAKSTHRDVNGKMKFSKIKSDEIIIPVFYEWLEDFSIVPYILSFMPSAMYNGAAVYQCNTDDERITNGVQLVVEGILEPCLYDIPAITPARITLVVCDSTSDAALPPTIMLSGIFAAERYEGSNITRFLYRQMGRLGGNAQNGEPWWNEPGITFQSCHTVVKRLTRFFHTAESAVNVRSKFMSLFGSIPLGSGVWTGGPKETKPSEWVSTEFGWNIDLTKQSNKIGGRVKLVSPSTWGDISDAFFAKHHWRVDVHGMLHKCLANASKDNSAATHWPCYGHLKYTQASFALSTMSPRSRLLAFSGLLKIGHDITKQEIVYGNAFKLFKFIQAQASLFAMTMNWFLAESGTTVPDLNSISAFRTSNNRVLAREALCELTDGWIMNINTTIRSHTKQEDYITSVSKGIIRAHDVDFFNRWYSGFVPTYMVCAVIKKFGVQVPYNNTRPDQAAPLDDSVTESNGDYAQIAYWGGTHSTWLDTALSTSTLKYERKPRFDMQEKFRIVLPDKNGMTVSPYWIGYYPRAMHDSNQLECNMYGVGGRIDLLNAGVVETLIVIVPYSRSIGHAYKTWWIVTSPYAHVKREDSETFVHLDSMEYPDPFFDWLLNGVKTSLPSLIRGDIIGAAGSFGLYALDSAVRWLRDNFEPHEDSYASGD